jgi:hypothetical protein
LTYGLRSSSVQGTYHKTVNNYQNFDTIVQPSNDVGAGLPDVRQIFPASGVRALDSWMNRKHPGQRASVDAPQV